MAISKRQAWLAAATIAFTAATANAGLTISPVRCAGDNLPQWSHDLDPAHYGEDANPAGTARGRNAWQWVCRPSEYKVVNAGWRQAGIKSEKDPDANHGNGTFTRWYPTYGVITSVRDSDGATAFERPGGFTAPTTAPASAGDSACALPPNYDFVGMCTSGCVTPDQEIAVEAVYNAIERIEQMLNPIVTVPKIGADGVSYEGIKVRRFVKDGTDALQKIAIIETKSGGSLRVSVNHPLLTEDYTMKRADSLKAGDSLVREDGAQDEITSVRYEEYYGKLHNLIVDTPKLEKSVYLVRGFISGDKKFQDVGVSDQNRAIFRRLVK